MGGDPYQVISQAPSARGPAVLTEAPQNPHLGPWLRHHEVRGSGAGGSRGKGCVVSALSHGADPRCQEMHKSSWSPALVSLQVPWPGVQGGGRDWGEGCL